MKRAKFNLSHYRMVTTEMGRLTPIGCVPVLPGDTVQQHTSSLVRVSPLNTPVMHPTNVRIHHFYVPNRTIMDGWEDFITGGKSGNSTVQIPTIGTTNDKESMLSYLGCPPIAGVSVSSLPLRALNSIINEYYADQDLVTPRDPVDNTPFNISWEKDYFSTSRPWSQRGPAVSVPVGESAPVTAQTQSGSVDILDSAGIPKTLDTSGATAAIGGSGTAGNVLQADLSAATGVSVNDFRAAFSIQRYQEARARYGARFTEYLRYLGITPSDARLQRPEFLGGGNNRLQFSEVLQTSPGSAGEAGVGDLYGHGIAGVKSNRYRKFFEEHGYIISLMSVRPKALYMNGLHREWQKTTKEDFYQKELANLGQQEVMTSELYAQNGGPVFGYQDRYDEYRQHPSQISNDFRDTLNAWHMGRTLESGVTLNQDFIDCKPSKRIFQITDESVNSLWCMVNHKIVARRMVTRRANPRII